MVQADDRVLVKVGESVVDWRSGNSQVLKLLGELGHLCYQGLNCTSSEGQILLLLIPSGNAMRQELVQFWRATC